MPNHDQLWRRHCLVLKGIDAALRAHGRLYIEHKALYPLCLLRANHRVLQFKERLFIASKERPLVCQLRMEPIPVLRICDFQRVRLPVHLKQLAQDGNRIDSAWFKGHCMRYSAAHAEFVRREPKWGINDVEGT